MMKAEQASEPITWSNSHLLGSDAADMGVELHDLLTLATDGDAQVIVENSPENGFEAWRALNRRYDPAGDQYTFDKVTALMARERCKDIGEFPGAIERWLRDLQLYHEKTGDVLPEK